MASGGGGSSSATSNTVKRGAPLGSPIEHLISKRAKTDDGLLSTMTTVGDAQLASKMFKKFVNTALDERAAGNTRPYQELRRKFIAHPAEDDAPSSLELRQTMSALTHSVSRLGKGCLLLVSDIVNTTWAGRDNLFFKAYLRLLGNLVSAHSNYMPMVTKMLVKHLALRSSRMCNLPNHKPVTRATVYNRTHEALQYIMELVPTAAHSTFLPALIAEFPNKSESRLAHTTFLANLLHVVEYTPALRSKVLAMVIERVIKIDIEVQADIEDLEVEDNELLSQEMHKTDDDGEDDSSEAEDDDEDEDEDEDDDAPMTPLQRIKETVDKLDSMMDILFTFIARYFPSDHSQGFILEPSAESTFIFDHLLESFHKTILPTYQSRHTQFIMFWAVQRSPKFIDIFLGELIGCAIDNNKSQVLRQAAAAYVASFVARARMMDKTNVRAAVSYLCSFLDTFIARREGDCTGPDIGRFGSFYAVFQAVMYIFCYRWRDLRVDEDDEDGNGDCAPEKGGRWIPGLLVVQRAVVSRFNPLKVCSDTVVEQFARVAQFLNLAYCFAIIEANNRSQLGGRNAASNGADHHQHTSSHPADRARLHTERTALETYFPFDPYLLRKSKRWVRGLYNQWERIPGMEEESEDESDDDEDDSGSDDDSGSGSDEEDDSGSGSDDDDDDDDGSGSGSEEDGSGDEEEDGDGAGEELR
ncbi:RNA polymerase I-specific transcription initiation factor RRN3 [Peziza echinospora]|nr:RNA polymerase I-specific transcription initiation factor RRN3 [Peziza echinospora]